MTPAPPLPPADGAERAPPSLWRELADGSAGPFVRAAVTLAVGVGLTGLVPIVAYFLTAMVPWFDRNPLGREFQPSEGVVAFLSAVAAGGFLSATAWLWTRAGRRREIVTPIVLTIGILVVTAVLCVLAEDSLPGDRELVVFGLVFLAFAAVMLIWLNAFRRGGSRWRALRNGQDGLPDVRCPACDYRMVGLTESRCPECGIIYTIDELIAKQGFAPTVPSVKPTLKSA